MGFDYNAVSIYDALKRYYFGDEELRKSIDKLFARFYNKKYSADMSNVMLDYCCGFTEGENRKDPSIAYRRLWLLL